MFDRCNGVAQVISWIRIGILTDFTEEERMDFLSEKCERIAKLVQMSF